MAHPTRTPVTAAAIALAAALLWLPAFPRASAPGPGPAPQEPELLVSGDWLAGRASDPSILLLHVERDPAAFEGGHIPEAILLDYDDIVDNDSELVTELPPVEHLERVLEAVGVSNDRHVVLYGHPILAARAFVTLEYLGHRAVSILDGGLPAWKAAGRSVATGPATPRTGDFEIRVRDDVVVDAQWVDAHRTLEGYALIDARPENEFTGEDGGHDGMHLAGHIPGAANVYWEDLMVSREDPRFRERAELEEIFGNAGADPGDVVVSYCFIGMRASVDYFVARLLGFETRFYDGSWNDWSMRGLAAETGPGGAR